MTPLLFVLLPGTLLLDIAGPAETFRLANRHLQQRGREAAFELRFVGTQASQDSSVGLTLSGIEALPERLAGPHWVALLGQASETLKRSLAAKEPAWLATRDWLSRQFAPQWLGGKPDPACAHRLITVCGGALLAADAGLLAGRRCTTHHELLDELQRLAPQADVVNNRVFVIDGPLATSAGVTAGIDLALQLIAAECGEDIAAAVAQDMVVYLRRGPRDPEISPLLQHRNHLHPAVHRVQDAVSAAPVEPWTMPSLATAACVTERHLLRLFTEHAGVSPLAYVELIRLEHARRALQGGASVGQAAEAAGFSSDLQLRRAWGRHFDSTPSAVRLRA
jgi:transcriptional regulator GlxA family with amidase domain